MARRSMGGGLPVGFNTVYKGSSAVAATPAQAIAILKRASFPVPSVIFCANLVRRMPISCPGFYCAAHAGCNGPEGLVTGVGRGPGAPEARSQRAEARGRGSGTATMRDGVTLIFNILFRCVFCFDDRSVVSVAGARHLPWQVGICPTIRRGPEMTSS